jgi:hypothetical protein
MNEERKKSRKKETRDEQILRTKERNQRREKEIKREINEGRRKGNENFMFSSCNPKLVWMAQPEIRPAENPLSTRNLSGWINPKFDQLKIPSQPETCLAGSTRNSTS